MIKDIDRKKIWTDFHCHCLPGIDDGAKNPEIASEMLKRLKKQGIDKVVATPHYYPFEESISSFLERRQRAYETLRRALTDEMPEIVLGAEVLLKNDISSEDLLPLCIEGTSIIMAELPWPRSTYWLAGELETILYSRRLIPMIAHIDRYVLSYTKESLDDILSLENIMLQVNNAAFSNMKIRRFLLDLGKEGFEFYPGSDSHNLTDRAPDFDRLKRAVKRKKYSAILAGGFDGEKT
jgi:protein-tyrosine phosphatase